MQGVAEDRSERTSVREREPQKTTRQMARPRLAEPVTRPVRRPLRTFRELVADVKTGPLRGEAKLRAALDAFRVDPSGKAALDVGAAAGGFTTVLLERGARIVYAVDAGHGQLRGALRQDKRVVNLEGVNLGDLTRRQVPEPVALFTVDVSYLSLAAAVPQLERIEIASGAKLIGLVKPMFELGLPSAPLDDESVGRALELAMAGVERAGWSVEGDVESPVRGARGAREHLLYAKRLG
ncbi:MAG TPA: SAM-dependent methyltransferase [Candidatus Dormibacteraeota bacterium]